MVCWTHSNYVYPIVMEKGLSQGQKEGGGLVANNVGRGAVVTYEELVYTCTNL